MSATELIRDLLNGGRVRVPRDVMLADLPRAVRWLEAHARVNTPGEPPPLDLAVGAWALTLVHRVCQGLVYRELDAGLLREALLAPCPTPPSPSVVYSADLALCTLPDLHRMARAISPDDPLVAVLEQVGSAWPLSSVGMPNVAAMSLEPIFGDPCLFRVYRDRVIERRDLSRLSNERVADAVRAALGAHPELAPEIANAVGIAA